MRERKPLEVLLELSHYTEKNQVTPLVLEYFTLSKYYKPRGVLGRMIAYYTPNTVKVESVGYQKEVKK